MPGTVAWIPTGPFNFSASVVTSSACKYWTMLPLTFDLATTYSVPPTGSMTGVPVIPTSGTRSLQPSPRAIHGGTAGGIKLTFRVHRSDIRIDGIHAVMLGHDVEHIVRPAGYAHRREIQRLRVDRAIDGYGK